MSMDTERLSLMNEISCAGSTMCPLGRWNAGTFACLGIFKRCNQWEINHFFELEWRKNPILSLDFIV